MNIPPTILDDVNAQLRELLADSASAHVDTGRRATVTMRITVSQDKETHKRTVRAKVSATVPEGVEDSHTRKLEPVLLLSVSDDAPGQMRIEQ